MDNVNAKPTRPDSMKLRRYMSWTAAAGTALFAFAFFSCILLGAFYGFWDDVAVEHFPAVIGLPSAAIAALFIVLVLRSVAGPVEFKALAVEFKGASGPIIMWMLCFLTMTLAIQILWTL